MCFLEKFMQKQWGILQIKCLKMHFLLHFYPFYDTLQTNNL